MNELLFFTHIVFVLGFTLLSLRVGKVALVVFATLQAVLANLFVLKQTSLFGLSVTCSDVFAVGGILSLNLLQDRYGKQAAKGAVSLSLLILLFFALMSQIHLAYIPAPFDTTQASYSTLLGLTPRLIGASIATFYIVQRFDVWFFGKLSLIQLPIRIALSLTLSQLIDTTLFSFLGLYGQVESLFDIIVFSFLVKTIVIGCGSLFANFSKRVVSRDIPV